MYQILDGDILKKACDDYQLCVIAVLPHILDTGEMFLHYCRLNILASIAGRCSRLKLFLPSNRCSRQEWISGGDDEDG